MVDNTIVNYMNANHMNNGYHLTYDGIYKHNTLKGRKMDHSLTPKK